MHILSKSRENASLLRPRRERPCHCRTAKEHDELAAPHSITLVGACEQHRFVSLTRSSMLLDCLAIAVSVLLSAGIRNAWAITLGSSPAQGRLVASYLTELVLQIAHLHPNVPGWENGRI